MTGIAIQLYTLRATGEPVAALLDRVSETPLEGVEFAGLGETGPGQVVDALDRTALAPAAAHVPMAELESDPGETARTYARLGCETLVVPYLDGSHFEDRAAVRETARRLNRVADVLAEWGVDLCYHNHDHEFVRLGGRPALELLADSLDEVGIELDVGWAAAAGVDPVALLDRLESVPLVHVKDVDADGTPVELGEGELDATACVAAAREAGAEWLVYEHDEPTDPLESLAHGARTLASLRDWTGD